MKVIPKEIVSCHQHRQIVDFTVLRGHLPQRREIRVNSWRRDHRDPKSATDASSIETDTDHATCRAAREGQTGREAGVGVGAVNVDAELGTP